MCLGLDFTPEFAALVLRTPIFADELVLVEGKCVEMAPAQFHEIVQHFAPTSLDISNCRLRTCQISDEFFRALIKNRVRRISLSHPPVDGDGFCVTDDAVIEFCAQHDVSIGQEGDEPEQPRRRDLELYHGRFTKDLFKRLIEVSI